MMKTSGFLARLMVGLIASGSSACAGGAPPVPTSVTLPAASSTRVLTLDFAACAPKREVVYGAMGSTTYEIVGPQGAQCVMNYGTEIENPNWNGVLDTHCAVPRSLNAQTFALTNGGADFAALAQYCKK